MTSASSRRPCWNCSSACCSCSRQDLLIVSGWPDGASGSLTNADSAVATRSITSAQLPRSRWRNSPMEGYQKLVSPVMPQRQSGTVVSSSQVGNGGVAGDDEITVGDDGRRLHEILGPVDFFLTIDKAMAEGAIRQLLGAVSLLQGEQADGGLLGDGGKGFQG